MSNNKQVFRYSVSRKPKGEGHTKSFALICSFNKTQVIMHPVHPQCIPRAFKNAKKNPTTSKQQQTKKHNKPQNKTQKPWTSRNHILHVLRTLRLQYGVIT